MENMHKEVLIELGQIKEAVNRLDTKVGIQNGSVAKHEARLATQDVLNAQMTMSQQQILNKLGEFAKSEKLNDDFRISSQASLATFKWLFGFLGIGNVIMFIKAFM